MVNLPEKRVYIRDRRPANLSIQRGCELMGVSRSSFYDEPLGRSADAVIVAEIRDITDEFEGYEYRRVDAELRHRGFVVKRQDGAAADEGKRPEPATTKTFRARHR